MKKKKPRKKIPMVIRFRNYLTTSYRFKKMPDFAGSTKRGLSKYIVALYLCFPILFLSGYDLALKIHGAIERSESTQYIVTRNLFLGDSNILD